MNEEIKNKIINLYTNEKLAAECISKQLKKEGIHLSRSPIGKFLTKEKNAGRVKQIAQEDYKGVKKYLKKQIVSKVRVLIEQVKNTISIGKSQYFTKIEIAQKLKEGSIVDCIITDVHENILKADLTS